MLILKQNEFKVQGLSHAPTGQLSVHYRYQLKGTKAEGRLSEKRITFENDYNYFRLKY